MMTSSLVLSQFKAENASCTMQRSQPLFFASATKNGKIFSPQPLRNVHAQRKISSNSSSIYSSPLQNSQISSAESNDSAVVFQPEILADEITDMLKYTVVTSPCFSISTQDDLKSLRDFTQNPQERDDFFRKQSFRDDFDSELDASNESEILAQIEDLVFEDN